MLRGTAIQKSYGEKIVLRDANITIERGQISVLTGPSGGGKTTLLRCLSLLEKPDKGSVELDEIRYDFESSKEKKLIPYPVVTIVFQQLFLWPHLTNRDNVVLSMPETQRGYFDHLIDRFEMKEFIDNYPNQSSLGQKQRVALTRALVLDPSYILLDEVTSALDDDRVDIVMEELVEIKARGKGMLVITHSTDLAKQLGDHFFKLERGSVRQIT